MQKRRNRHGHEHKRGPREAETLTHRQTRERRRAAGGPGRPGADTQRPRRRPSAPARRAPARAHLGPLTPRSRGSWRAAPCPRSASVSRGARRAAGGGRGAAFGRTRGRTEGRTPTAPPPRRPGGARRAGRGKGAAERTGSNQRRRRTGSGSDRATRPVAPSAASLRSGYFRGDALPRAVTSGAREPSPGGTCLISARLRETPGTRTERRGAPRGRPASSAEGEKTASSSPDRPPRGSPRPARPRPTAVPWDDLNSWAHKASRMPPPPHFMRGPRPTPVLEQQATQAGCATSGVPRARVPVPGRQCGQLGLPGPSFSLGPREPLRTGEEGVTHTGHRAAP